jgi:hypothetical protein
MRANAKAKRPETDIFLIAVIWIFGLSPIVLGVSLALAQTFHLFH